MFRSSNKPSGHSYPNQSAASFGYKVCLNCKTLVPTDQSTCPVCYATVALRRRQSLQRTAALLLTAFILFFPANLLPTMTTISLLGTANDTILSGVLYLWQNDDQPIAIIVFIASFITPLFKMISIAYLCYTCWRRSSRHIRFRAQLYHFNELIGRWSMIDVFVVALIGSLVQMGSLATVIPRPAIVAFSIVVFLTMFAMQQFDPRLIWDNNDDYPNKPS